VGDYLIEPYGFTATPSHEDADSIKRMLNASVVPQQSDSSSAAPRPPSVLTVDLPRPKRVISVSDQAGISSSAITQVLAQSLDRTQSRLLDLSVYPLWNPLTGETHDMVFSDGLGGDNTAILSLLRRRVTKICAMFATNISIAKPVDHTNLDISGFGDVAALFGVMTCDGETFDGMHVNNSNRYRQVFPSEDFAPLLRGLQDNYRAGKPCTFLLHTRALPNALVGVPGNHPVDLLLILAAPSDGWVNSLPNSIRSKVLHLRRGVDKALGVETSQDSGDGDDDDDEGEEKMNPLLRSLEEAVDGLEQGAKGLERGAKGLKDSFRRMFYRSNLKRDFPFPITESLNLSVDLVNLLTNLLTWEVLESKHLFDELLQEARA
jgi:hypothetical protein